jgi:hypothetical protein
MAQGTEIGPEGNLPIGAIPQPAGGPLNFIYPLIAVLPMQLPPCESEVIL